MASYFGGLTANYNVLCQRALNLADLTDPAAARFNIGAFGASDTKTLTFGYGLTGTSYTPLTAGSISVDASVTGESNKVVKYTSDGGLIVGSATSTLPTISFVNGLCSIARAQGTNGLMTLTNAGSGNLIISNGSGDIKLNTGSGGVLTLDNRTGAVGGYVTLETGGNLTVSKGLTTPGSVTAATVNSTDIIATTVTSGTIAGGPSFSDGATVATGKTLTMSGAYISGTPTFTDGFSAATGMTLALAGVSISGAPTFTGGATFNGPIRSPSFPSFSYELDLLGQAPSPATNGTIQPIFSKPVVSPNGAVVVNWAIGTGIGAFSVPQMAFQIITPGRYVFHLTCQVEGNGLVQFGDKYTVAGGGYENKNTFSADLVNGTTPRTTYTRAFIFDVPANDIVSVFYKNLVVNSGFTLYSAFFSGHLLG